MLVSALSGLCDVKVTRLSEAVDVTYIKETNPTVTLQLSVWRSLSLRSTVGPWCRPAMQPGADPKGGREGTRPCPPKPWMKN